MTIHICADLLFNMSCVCVWHDCTTCCRRGSMNGVVDSHDMRCHGCVLAPRTARRPRCGRTWRRPCPRPAALAAAASAPRVTRPPQHKGKALVWDGLPFAYIHSHNARTHTHTHTHTYTHTHAHTQYLPRYGAVWCAMQKCACNRGCQACTRASLWWRWLCGVRRVCQAVAHSRRCGSQPRVRGARGIPRI